jgi:hypothetical protein
LQLLQALIAAVGEHLQALVRLKVAALVEGEVMDGAARVSCANNPSGAPVDDDLAF